MKCFLSHSSADKESYVRFVAEKLRRDMIVYDEFTFDAGMRNSDEILRGLDATDLFVLFISDSALNSSWVRIEIMEAYDRLARGDIDRIYPIIIDPSITHDDPRILDWMRIEYNLRLVTRPTAAVRRIEQRLRELSWQRHPKIREKEKIFVGRNDLIKAFEERLDDISIPTPTCIIASGLKKIGRRSFVRHALTKTNVIDPSYDPLRIYLSQDDGIEGFILKLYDLGLSPTHSLERLMSATVEEKTKLATAICRDIYDAKDVILIEDDGSIVTYNSTISYWFLDILNILAAERVLFAIASGFRLNARPLWGNTSLYILDVPELSRNERFGLLKRYADLEDIYLSRDDFEYVGGLLQGYPEQAFFAIDVIKSSGIDYVRTHSADIIDFNRHRAAIVLRRYEDQPLLVDLLRFLADFEFVSYNLVNDVVDDPALIKAIERFVIESICEEVGASREYVRVNDIIRDYIFRNRLALPERYAEKLRECTKSYIKSNNTVNDDVSQYLYYIKTALAQGLPVDDRFLVPAHFLMSLRDAYETKRHGDVVKLCDKVLESKHFIEKRLEDDVRYFLCSSLARLRNNRFLKEVQNIQGSEHDFLMGFYYRLQGRYKEAVERQTKAMESRRSEKRARRELVQNYMYMEDFDKALSVAYENYKLFPYNPFLVQSYLNCLLQQPKTPSNRADIGELINVLELINSERSREMAATAKAFVLANYDNDEKGALLAAQDAIETYPTSVYPLLAKLDIALRFLRLDIIHECLAVLRPEMRRWSNYYNIVKRGEATLLTAQGQFRKGRQIVETEMRNYSDSARARLLERLDAIAAGLGHQ